MSSPDGPNEDGTDVETLQAQIDMSLAHTQDLVSSWLKPKYGSKSTSSSRLAQEKELQDILKRPARLGVGAPIPSSTSIASRDAMKLKGKLTGKKRGRDDEGAQQDAPSDDEQESKATAVKKKARHDPFAPKAKKKVPVPPPIAPLEPATPSSPPKASTSQAAESVNDNSPSPKKKKKKHHRLTEIQDDAVTAAEPAETSQKAAEGAKASHKTPSSPLKAVSSSQESPRANAKLPIAPPASPAKSSAQDIPILNLDGPPPVVDGSPSKKKRKRNKKKKRKPSGQMDDAPEADPEDDASS